MQGFSPEQILQGKTPIYTNGLEPKRLTKSWGDRLRRPLGSSQPRQERGH